jgi:hypothetical protein
VHAVTVRATRLSRRDGSGEDGVHQQFWWTPWQRPRRAVAVRIVGS